MFVKASDPAVAEMGLGQGLGVLPPLQSYTAERQKREYLSSALSTEIDTTTAFLYNPL